MYELNQALAGVRNTSPGKDEICNEVIRYLSDKSKNILLYLFNRVWKLGKLPSSWKHGIIIPIVKPGKDHSQVTSYRPIALTSNLRKLMERMVVARLIYVLESKNIYVLIRVVLEKVEIQQMQF